MFDDDIVALVDDELARGAERVRVLHLRVVCGTEGPQEATLTVSIDGEERTATSIGDGPVDAVFNAIRELVPHSAVLRLFQVHAVTEGTDAQAKVSVRLEEGGHIASGLAADTDTLTASAKAYVNALNSLFVRREKAPPPAQQLASGFQFNPSPLAAVETVTRLRVQIPPSSVCAADTFYRKNLFSERD